MSQKKTQLINPLSGNINVAGVITASSFVGSGEGLTGVASTDNIQTATEADFLSGVKIAGVTTFTNALSLSSANAKINTGNGINVVFQDQGTDKIHFEVSTQSIRPQTANTGELGNATYPFEKITAGAASFSGNVTIGGTLTYQDVSNVDSVGLITARKGIQVLADGINVTGVTTVGTALSLADNVKAQFGNDGDLQIYHDGSTSRIDNAVGSIVIKNNANDSDIQFSTDDGSGGVTTYILCDGSAGEVDLYYYGSRKLNTTTTGVTVTGTLAATAVTSDDYTGNLELDVFLFG